MSAYHYAAQGGNLIILRYLDHIDVDNKCLTKKGVNALHLASQEGNLNCVDYLIKEMEFNPNILTTSNTKSNCLHLACKNGHIRTV